VACTGARPVAATNCLNFGNPEKPEVMWQFTQAIDGISEACTALEAPITGGNVSFYNETLGKAIYPTPILGVLGIIEDAECAVGSAFRNEGDAIVLLDAGRAAYSQDSRARELSSSEYAKFIQGVVAGEPPAIDLDAEKRLINCLVDLASEKVILSAHDVSDGGLAVTIAESCFGSDGLSAEVKVPADGPTEYALFGERGARATVSASPALLARIQSIAAQYKVSASRVGTVTRGEFHLECGSAQAGIRGRIDSFQKPWAESLPDVLES
ncbi:MAG TPA: AIR synthase related protein, partial [Candidatus Acidoferrales bacterium]|nr:AIR synthase related protein [Candidatus Acidoferrales bacterium]